MQYEEIMRFEAKCRDTGVFEEVVAMSLVSRGDCEAAQAFLIEALQRESLWFPENVRYRLAEAYRCTGDLDRAAEHLLEAIRSHRRKYGTESYRFHDTYVRVLLRALRPEAAVVHLQATLTLDDHWTLNRLLTLAYATVHDCENAYASGRKALSQRPALAADSMILIVLSDCGQRTGKTDEARAIYKAAAAAHENIRENETLQWLWAK